MASKNRPTRKVNRDAGTGQFVKTGENKRRPKQVVRETVPVRRKGK